MLNMEEQDDVVPGTKIMMSYKKAMELDEENDEYIADFASFALECRRVPQAVKEFQRYSRRLEMADIPTDDVLYMAARNIVDTIEVIDPEKANPMVQPWVKQALIWAVGGLGYTPEEALKSSLQTIEVHVCPMQKRVCISESVTWAMPFTAAKFNRMYEPCREN